jgi:hypothetical protein
MSIVLDYIRNETGIQMKEIYVLYIILVSLMPHHIKLYGM